MHLEHVNLTVADLEQSIDFYRRLFGFTVRWSGATSDGKPAAHLGNDTFYLALFQARDSTIEPHKSYDRVGLNHVGFVIDDMEAMKQRLVELNTSWDGEQTYDPGHHLYFFDPSGIEIELVQYAAGESAIPETATTPAAFPGSDTPLRCAISTVRLGFENFAPELPLGGLALPR